MLKTRVITALLLLGGLLIVVFALPRYAAACAFAAVAALAAWEWGGLVGATRAQRTLFVVAILLSCLGAFLTAEVVFPSLWLVAGAFWLLAVPPWLIRGWRPRGALRYLVGWIVVVPTWAAMLALRDRGAWWLLIALAMTWVADIAAYFAGRAFGRHKLAPGISPGKTWEGVLGAVVGVLVYAEVAAWLTGTVIGSPLGFVAALLVVVAVSVVGDLFESLAKRQAGVKDSGRILPGHGGVLDRIDSQTSALPFLALAAHWWS